MSEWISVKDRLPDRLETVLLVWAPRQSFPYNETRPMDHEYPTQKKVTHWMKLPEPPK